MVHPVPSSAASLNATQLHEHSSVISDLIYKYSLNIIIKILYSTVVSHIRRRLAGGYDSVKGRVIFLMFLERCQTQNVQEHRSSLVEWAIGLP